MGGRGSGPGRDPRSRAARGAGAACWPERFGWFSWFRTGGAWLGTRTPLPPSALQQGVSPMEAISPSAWALALTPHSLGLQFFTVRRVSTWFPGETGEQGQPDPQGGACALPGLSQTPLQAVGGRGWGHGEGREAPTRPTTSTRHLSPQLLLTHTLKWAGNAHLGMSALCSEKHTCFSMLPRPLPALASPVASLSATLGGRKWHRLAPLTGGLG